jgi:hypothetical protein
MCRAIDQAYKVDEVKEIRDKAVALEAYAKQAKNTEAERRACEIRLRAERKAGQLLAKTVKRGGSKSRGPTLKPSGISKEQSANWQKLGAVPQADFDLALEQSDKPTTNGIIRATEPPKPNPVSREALWLWGRLGDFDRDLLAKNPADVMATMTPQMKDDVHTLAPRVAAWLRRIGEVPS